VNSVSGESNSTPALGINIAPSGRLYSIGEISDYHDGEYEDILRDIPPCSLSGIGRRFRDAYCLHHQGDECFRTIFRMPSFFCHIVVKINHYPEAEAYLNNV
jgi:hypothetical protein